MRTCQVSAADFQWSELLLLNVMFYKMRLNKVFYVEEMADRHSCHLRLSEPVGTAQGQSSALQLDSNGCIYAFNHKCLGAYFSREFSWSKAEWGPGSRFACSADLRAPDWISWAEANCADSPSPFCRLTFHLLILRNLHPRMFTLQHGPSTLMQSPSQRKASLTKLRLLDVWLMASPGLSRSFFNSEKSQWYFLHVVALATQLCHQTWQNDKLQIRAPYGDNNYTRHIQV